MLREFLVIDFQEKIILQQTIDERGTGFDMAEEIVRIVAKNCYKENFRFQKQLKTDRGRLGLYSFTMQDMHVLVFCTNDRRVDLQAVYAMFAEVSFAIADGLRGDAEIDALQRLVSKRIAGGLSRQRCERLSMDSFSREKALELRQRTFSSLLT